MPFLTTSLLPQTCLPRHRRPSGADGPGQPGEPVHSPSQCCRRPQLKNTGNDDIYKTKAKTTFKRLTDKSAVGARAKEKNNEQCRQLRNQNKDDFQKPH